MCVLIDTYSFFVCFLPSILLCTYAGPSVLWKVLLLMIIYEDIFISCLRVTWQEKAIHQHSTCAIFHIKQSVKQPFPCRVGWILLFPRTANDFRGSQSGAFVTADAAITVKWQGKYFNNVNSGVSPRWEYHSAANTLIVCPKGNSDFSPPPTPRLF